MKRTLCILLTLLLTLSLFAACSKAGTAAGDNAAANLEPTLKNVSGSYNLKSLNGQDIKEVLIKEMGAEQAEAFLQQAGLTGNDLSSLITITLKEDGTCSITEAGISIDGTWKLEGSKVSITIEGDTETGTWSNGILTLNASEDDDSKIKTMELQKIS